MNDVATLERPASTELVPVNLLTPAVFTEAGGIDRILKQITDKVRAFKGDISTAQGRKDMASMSKKVRSSKAAIDRMGKELGESHYKTWKAIAAERTRVEGILDALAEEVRRPLTEWENAEKDRVEAHEAALYELQGVGAFGRPEPTLEAIDGRLAELARLETRQWQEFATRAGEAAATARQTLTTLREATIKREAERAELARLRKEQEERKRREREDKIAAEAAEHARRQAEAKAQAEARAAEHKAALERERIEQERLRAEREKQDAEARARKAEADAKAAAEKAERDKKAAAEAAERARIAAEEKAERDRVAAIEAERKRVADAEAAEKEAARIREANQKHVAAVNNEIAAALKECAGLDTKTAHIIIAAIARGEVPHTSIEY